MGEVIVAERRASKGEVQRPDSRKSFSRLVWAGFITWHLKQDWSTHLAGIQVDHDRPPTGQFTLLLLISLFGLFFPFLLLRGLAQATDRGAPQRIICQKLDQRRLACAFRAENQDAGTLSFRPVCAFCVS